VLHRAKISGLYSTAVCPLFAFSQCIIVDSTPSLGVYYFLSLTLSVAPSVCDASPSNRFFFFVSWWNRAIFCPSVLRVALYKTLFVDFWFRPPNSQNLHPKNFYGTCVMAARQSVHTKTCMCVGPTLVAMATKFGLGAESSHLPVCCVMFLW